MIFFKRKTTAEKIQKQYEKLAKKNAGKPICQDPDFEEKK